LDLNITLDSSLLGSDGFATASLKFDVGGPAPPGMRRAKAEIIRLKVSMQLDHSPLMCASLQQYSSSKARSTGTAY